MLLLSLNQCIIKNYQQFIAITSHTFSFILDKMLYTITGKDLSIHYYSKKEIRIDGLITNISIQPFNHV